MRKIDLGLPVALLFLAALPLGCSNSGGGPKAGGGSGGSSQSGGSGGSAGSGGSSAQGGSGGTTTSTGGNAGSGGSQSGGASGGSGGGGGTTFGTGGEGGRGGSGGGSGGTSSGGAAGGSGGTAAGGAGGTGPGGSGGSSPGGTGGQGTGGSTSGDGGPEVGGSDTLADVESATCTDKKTNGDETDVDCGGGTCPKCGAGKTCKIDADCKSGTCDNGKCPDAFAATGTVTNSGNLWRITMGTLVFEVDQATAGKVVTFSLDGTNFLVANNASTGSVYWTAPQSDWNWPPPPEMDTSAYTPTSQDNILTMTGPKGTYKTQGDGGVSETFQITKRFWGNVEHQTVTLEYTFTNAGSAAVKKAPWEITRVYPGGLTFFPNAEPPVVLPGTSNSFLAVPFTTAAGAAWWKYQKADFTQDVKGGADGLEGWAAQINCAAGLEQTCTTTTTGSKSMILIKEWQDATAAAPGEKEVELYGNAGHNYVEFEQQGDYQTIAAGGTMVWTMHWMLRYLPTTVAATAGNQALVDWVRGQLL